MAVLTEDKNRHRVLGDIQGYPMLGGSKLYEGSVVGINSGYASQITSDDTFVGFCEQTVDNGRGVAGELDVRVLTRGTAQLDVTGVEVTDVGRPVYTTDGDSFTLNGVGAKIGAVARFINPGVAEVYFDAFGVSVEVNTLLTFSIDLANVLGGFVVKKFELGFSGRFKAFAFVVNEPVITPSKSFFLITKINNASVPGAVTLLNSDNCAPMGNVIYSFPVTGKTGFIPGDALSFVGQFVTPFAEGSGSLVAKLGR